MSDQVLKVAVSPAQRWVLLNLSHSESQRQKGQQGRVYRRFMRAFALDSIQATMREHGSVSAAVAESWTPALFTITAENAEYAKGLSLVEHSSLQEDVVGPLFDALDERDAAPPADVPDFDPAKDDWSPVEKNESDPVEAVSKKIAEFLASKGHAEAAALVSAGAWDTPEAPSAAE